VLKIASVSSPPKVITWHHRITRKTPERSARGKCFRDNFVCDEDGLAYGLKPARQSVALDSFQRGAGWVGFFEHETHFGDEAGAPGALRRPVFCGRGRDAPDKLGSDQSGSKFRNKIIDEIEQGAQKTCGRIGLHNNVNRCYIKYWLSNGKRSPFAVRVQRAVAAELGGRVLALDGLSRPGRLYLHSEVFDLKPTKGIGVLAYSGIGVLGYWGWSWSWSWSVGRPQTDQWSILRLMSTLPKVRDLLEGHITLELDSID
jgi:hypothetical protein